jgi:hypothetical protein
MTLSVVANLRKISLDEEQGDILHLINLSYLRAWLVSGELYLRC